MHDRACNGAAGHDLHLPVTEPAELRAQRGGAPDDANTGSNPVEDANTSLESPPWPLPSQIPLEAVEAGPLSMWRFV